MNDDVSTCDVIPCDSVWSQVYACQLMSEGRGTAVDRIDATTDTRVGSHLLHQLAQCL